MEHKDDLQHKQSKLYKSNDPQVQLRMLTERLGGLGYPFNLSPECRAYASEMRQVRNLWAHNEPFTVDDVQRYLDTSFRLLHAVGAEGAAEQTRSLLTE
ncbi:Swt1 family HEPN domain-containing protein, partial [Arthrobacter sp. H5]